mgnify:CR=1 FL=1
MVMGGRKVGRFGVRIGVRMFSMEDRRRAVDLYFTEGMTIRKVVAKLGYPSEGALAKWVRENPRCTVPLAFHKFYLLRYCVFCTPHVRNVGIPPLCETYPPFCEHPPRRVVVSGAFLRAEPIHDVGDMDAFVGHALAMPVEGEHRAGECVTQSPQRG